MQEMKQGQLSIDEIKHLGAEVAAELQGASAPVPEPLRQRFIAVRTALYHRGIYDPVLVRFDTATSTPATSAEVGAQLATVIESLA